MLENNTEFWKNNFGPAFLFNSEIEPGNVKPAASTRVDFTRQRQIAEKIFALEKAKKLLDFKPLYPAFMVMGDSGTYKLVFHEKP
ncbi:MAG: hypothetical protein PHI12_12010 [Dehalococcoidales bacterium]|nr:hypothetical protein [Dehalococcoidales bacterium]